MRALALTAALAGCAGHGIPSVPWGDAGARDVTVKDVSTTTDTAAYVVADAPRSEAAVDAASDASVDGSVDATRDATADAFADGSLDAATDVPVDAPPWFPCAPGVQRDLDALGTRVGDTTTVHGDNRAAGAMTVLPSACAVGYAGYEVAYRYVPRRTTTLRVSTNAMGTDARLDTVVFALSACLPLDGGARSLGCNDDTGDPPRDHASTFITDAAVTAGVPVFIVVAGFLHATHDIWDSQGAFELSVTEQ